MLSEKHLTLSVAESLTGGLLADAFVSVPGASEVFAGGCIAYTDKIKQIVLSVPGDILASCTAVSGNTALLMAKGAKALFQTDIALSTTGYAGPAGENAGLFYVALAAGGKAAVRKIASPRIQTGRKESRGCGCGITAIYLFERMIINGKGKRNKVSAGGNQKKRKGARSGTDAFGA